MDAVEATLARIAVINEDTDRRLNGLTQKLDNFIYESNRLRTNSFERLERIEAAIESLVGIAQANSRKGNENRADIAALSQVVQATTQNVDRVVRAVEDQGVRLDTLINRIVTDPDEN
ncbi:MAG: hypothetical protein ACTS2F_25375 [Thainema sp.]